MRRVVVRSLKQTNRDGYAASIACKRREYDFYDEMVTLLEKRLAACKRHFTIEVWWGVASVRLCCA